MHKSILLILFLIVSNNLFAQREEGIFNLFNKKSDSTNAKIKKKPIYKLDRLGVGPGYGFEYGGIGLNGHYYLDKHFAVFLAAGYDLVGIGSSLGIKYRFFSREETWISHPYLIVMHGVNAVFKVENIPDLNRSFYGLTTGIGIEPKWKSHKLGYWSFSLLFPLLSNEAKEYKEFLVSSTGGTLEDSVLPDEIRLSLGYHFVIR